MASENETVMAVCAEWRECIESADPSVWNNERIAGLVKTTKAQQLAYLNRIEAAWKRDEERAVEHATRHAEVVARDNCRDCIHNPNGKNYEGGDAAALREALAIARQFVLPNVYSGERRIVKRDGNEVLIGAYEALEVVDAALAKPARNCDVLYKTSWDIITHWDGGLDSAKSIVRLLDWLLAPAAERKGEGDAN